MYFVVIFLITVIMFTFGQVAETYLNSAHDNKVFFKKMSYSVMVDAVTQYYKEFKAYPASLDSLGATAGFEFIKTYTATGKNYTHSPIGIAVSGNLMEGSWIYQRVALMEKTDNLIDGGSNWMAYGLAGTANDCGSTDFFATGKWCPKASAKHKTFVIDSRQQMGKALALERKRQERTISKFVQTYNKTGTFYDTGATAVLVKDNLAALGAGEATAPGTVSACTSSTLSPNWRFGDTLTPIDCSDLFDSWGNPVYYYYFATDSIFLISKTPYKTNTGENIIVATEVTL